MFRSMHLSRLHLILILLVFSLLAAPLATAVQLKTVPDPVPRIAVVGDSWGMFLWWFRSFQKALNDLGYGDYVETANESVVGGGLTYQFVNEVQFPAAAQIRAGITRMLEENPTIDVVVVSLGGNDVMQGTEYVLPEDPNREIEMQCPGDPNDYNEILLEKIINQDLANLVQYILDVRPDIRVLLTSYDFAGINDKANCDLQTQQQGFMIMDIYKQRLADAMGPRVHFVSSYGLMQYSYGVNSYTYDGSRDIIPESETPVYPAGTIPAGFTVADYPPLQLPNPDDIWTTPWTEGGTPALIPGYPQYHTPLVALLDKEIHLTEAGYDIMAHRIVDRVLRTWLDYPKAFEILPIEGVKGAQYQFQVTFSEPVSGVDAGDFEVATAMISAQKVDISQAQVIGVSPASGFSQTFTVTIDLNPGAKSNGTEEVVHIHVLDDDSIVDAQGDPLGGPNEGGWNENGMFTYYGPFAFADLLKPASGDFPSVQHYLDVLTKPYMPFINFALSFDESELDLNGNLTELINGFLSDEIDTDHLYIKGNGLLEAYEFAMIMEAVNNPALDLSATGGVTHQIAYDAWNHNITQMQMDLGGVPTEENPNMLLDVLSGIDSVFAGYFTMGEPTLTTLLGVGSQFLADALNDFIPDLEVQLINPANYDRLPQYFGAMDQNGDQKFDADEFGDADGDGYTNAEEYLYFQADGIDGFLAAALDPNVVPPDFQAQYGEGQHVRLYVPELLHASKTTYQWYINGEPVADGFGIMGANTRTLDFAQVAMKDAGAYTCVYNENKPDPVGGKSLDVTYGPITLDVAEAQGDGVTRIVGPAWVEEGTPFALRVIGASGNCAWTKDGTPLAETSDTYSVSFASMIHGGVYRVHVNTGSQVIVTPDFVVTVVPAGTLPLAALPALVALGAVLGIAGALRTHKK